MKGHCSVGIFRKILAAGLLALLLALAGGCGSRDEGAEPVVEEQSDTLKIGMSFDSFVIERWLRDRDQFSMTANNLGAEVNVQVANGEVDEQISQIRYFIKKKMDVIVVIAVDGGALSEVVDEAKKEGIRVISYDRLLLNSDTDLYISFDNEKVGTLMGEALVDALPDGGNIFAIYGSPTDHNVSLVRDGFLAVVGESNLNVIFSAYCENWLAELAFDAVEEGMATTPRNLVGVMCGNDDLASQAFRALAENRLAGKVVMVGQDADLAACQRIVEGTQTMTVYKPVEELAQTAAEFAAALGYEKMVEEGRIQEDEVPKIARDRLAELETLPTISDGSAAIEDNGELFITVTGSTLNGDQWRSQHPQQEQDGYEVPYYGLEPIAVTKENIDEVIIGNDFHTEEDVYLNTGKE